MPPVLVWDSETWLITEGWASPRIVCAAFMAPHRAPWLLAREDALDELEAWLRLPDCIFINQAIAFDWLCACALRPSLIPLVFKAYREGRVRDVGIRQQLIDIELGCLNYRKGLPKDIKSAYSLAGLMWIHFKIDRSADKAAEAWRYRYRELEDVPVKDYPPEAHDYPLQDVNDAHDVFLAQAQNFADPYAPNINEVEQVRKAWALKLASCWGLRCDGKSVDALEAEITAKYLKIQTDLAREGLFKVRKCAKKAGVYEKSDEISRELLVEIHADAKILKAHDEGLPLRFAKDTAVIQARVAAAYEAMGTKPKYTPSGDVCCDADALAQTGDETLMELGGGGPVGTIRNTFIPTLRKGTSRPINTEYRPLVETGRVSSAKPGLNNIPRGGGVRECFASRPGTVLCSTDYACAELRGLGQIELWLFGESEFAAFFRANPHGDPHLELAASISGIPYIEAQLRLKTPCEPGCEHTPYIACGKYVKGMRQACKALNFGLPGGLGVDTLIATARRQYGVHFTRAEAQQRKDQWMTRWKMKKYFAHINRLVGMGNATIEQLRPPGPNGENVPHRRRGNVGYCDGANTFFQGIVADAAAEALFALSEESYTKEESPLFGSRPLLFLYDEAILEIPHGPKTHEAAYRQAELFVSAAQVWIPDVPMISEPALMYRWSKEAEAVFDAEGRLVPWEPKKAA